MASVEARAQASGVAPRGSAWSVSLAAAAAAAPSPSAEVLPALASADARMVPGSEEVKRSSGCPAVM